METATKQIVSKLCRVLVRVSSEEKQIRQERWLRRIRVERWRSRWGGRGRKASLRRWLLSENLKQVRVLSNSRAAPVEKEHFRRIEVQGPKVRECQSV